MERRQGEFPEGRTLDRRLSLRLSAGRTGNDAISAYRSLAAMSSTTSGYLFDGMQPAPTTAAVWPAPT
ncbi:MAG: hypothetical protein ACLRMJ_03720 [Alistipes finegoldii]